MHDLQPVYRREVDRTLIELRLDDARQLFDTRDPAPFWQRDLDRDAAAYIESAAGELTGDVPLKLVVHLPATAIAAAATAELDVERAMHTFFAWQSEVARLRFKALLAAGRLALLIGLLFLAACLGLAGLVRELGLGWPGEVLQEGLVIIGWVALWRPAEIFLYEWWPLHRHRRRP